jgi:putative glutamine amidotransferase
MSTTARRPRILVTVDEDVTAGHWDDYSTDYARAVEAAGGEAIPIYYGRYAPDAVPPHDGIVTIGGVDVDPAQYGEAPHPRLDQTVPARDTAEIALTRLALETGRPLLAICRGAQVMNVACGGSLLQHIKDGEWHTGPPGTEESAWHDVTVTPGSLLARVAGAGPLRVNSRHHQAVTPERLAPGLVEAGRTDEGGLVVVEAFEARGAPLCAGRAVAPGAPGNAQRPDATGGLGPAVRGVRRGLRRVARSA